MQSVMNTNSAQNLAWPIPNQDNEPALSQDDKKIINLESIPMMQHDSEVTTSGTKNIKDRKIIKLDHCEFQKQSKLKQFCILIAIILGSIFLVGAVYPLTVLGSNLSNPKGLKAITLDRENWRPQSYRNATCSKNKDINAICCKPLKPRNNAYPKSTLNGAYWYVDLTKKNKNFINGIPKGCNRGGNKVTCTDWHVWVKKNAQLSYPPGKFCKHHGWGEPVFFNKIHKK